MSGAQDLALILRTYTSAPSITPRRAQFEALAAILDALDHGLRRPLVEAPCGWGKSILIAMLALALVQRGRRVLILAHRHELLEQNTGALLRLDPAADVGICSASLRSDQLDAAIVVGGAATIFRRVQRLGRVDAERPRWVRIHAMRGGIYKKPGRPPSFRLRYATEDGWVSEFLSLEHEKSGARWYAKKAWSRLSRTPGVAPPASARDAYQRFISGELREPQRLRIERDGEWWRVVDIERPAP